MAKNTIYVSGGDVDEELETEIVEIYTGGPNKSGMCKLSIVLELNKGQLLN